MTREEFRTLAEERLLLLDGATGSNLLSAGMPVGACPEEWILKHPEVLVELQKKYLRCGVDILYTPTFSGNRLKLAEYGLQDSLEEINTSLVGFSKRAVGEFLVEGNKMKRFPYLAGDMTMTGKQLVPIGTLSFEEAVEVYKEQARVLEAAGVDLFVIETMMSLQECRAAVLAVRETSELPVMVTLTFTEENRTLYGTEPETAVLVLQGLGADAVGVNCSTGPEQMAEVVRRMKAVANVPIIAKPNAGLPKLINGETVYDMAPQEFAEGIKRLVEAGAGIVGGCCGTTPLHMEYAAERIAQLSPPAIQTERIAAVTNERCMQRIVTDGEFLVVGERINPTGKKALQAELREGKLDLVLEMAQQQETCGAKLLDVNVGMSGIDEKETMCRVITEVAGTVNLPLSIDTSHVEVMEAALRLYPGRALMNSISLEESKMEPMLALAKKYGAMFVLLPLSSEGLPKNLEEKHEYIRTLLYKAQKLGLSKEDIVVDALVTTVGANPQAAKEALATIRYCREELGLPTVCGLSNISFGLPERGYVNTAFLTMAVANGMTMAIANPSDALLMNELAAAELLLGKEEAAQRYIDRLAAAQSAAEQPAVVQTAKEGTFAPALKGEERNAENEALYRAILKGDKRNAAALTNQALQAGSSAEELLKQLLIPAINEVGSLFEQKKYFLPQLINSAEAMKLAIEVLEPLLEAGGSGEKRGTVVIATVAGDIHDIGKNLVALMLKNYGFQVHDLGKDVPSEEVIRVAKETQADIIALSALMTTTMLEMKQVVRLRNEAGLTAKIMIGGAVITEDYAKEIGADAYSKDAREAVVVAEGLLSGDYQL